MAGGSAAAWERLWDRPPEWRGIPCQQFPSDLWRYAELVWELHPPFVLEVGSAAGGTALFLADVMRAAGDGLVLSVDIRQPATAHPRLVKIEGDAADPVTVTAVTELAGGARGLVLLDGDHSPAQVLRELDAYSPLACYLVTEDTIMEVLPQFGGGPHTALAGWLPDHPEFAPDPDPDPTQHPGGWLRRAR